jgi:hypothetical protein
MRRLAALERLPQIAPGATFVPFHEVRGRPHVVVDGPFVQGTVLGLSHWPDGGVPDALAADTSAAIVARYLDAGADGTPVGIVTNNHFDEDGLLAAWLLLEGVTADPVRRRAIAAAEAGDFQTWTDPEAAWTAITLMAMAERATTPFPDVLRAMNRAQGHDPAGAITIALLPHVGTVVDDPGRFRRLWEPVWRRVEHDLNLLETEAATIEDLTRADLAIVRAPEPLVRLAVHPHTGSMRVIHACADGRLWLEHRYETWVRYASRRLPPRIDLTLAARRLTEIETGAGTWRFEGVEHPVARLICVDSSGAPTPSGLTPEAVADAVLTLAVEEPARG